MNVADNLLISLLSYDEVSSPLVGKVRNKKQKPSLLSLVFDSILVSTF